MNANPIAPVKSVETMGAEKAAEPARKTNFAWQGSVKMPHANPIASEKSVETMGVEKAAVTATPIWKSVRAERVSKCPLIVFPIAQG